MFNYHIHTDYTNDASGKAVDYCQKAEELNFKEICFTNHFYVKTYKETNPINSITLPRLTSHINEINDLKKDYSFKIKVGLEMDFIEGYENEIKDIIENNELDFVIGSAHHIQGLNVADDREANLLFHKLGVEQAYKEYFKVLFKLIQSQLFDVVGHIDVIKKYTNKFIKYVDFDSYKDMALSSIDLLKEYNMGFEINTSGLRQPVKEIYPCPLFIGESKKNNLRNITIGTDAHAPEQIDFGLEKGFSMLREQGIDKVSTFSKRRQRFSSIKR